MDGRQQGGNEIIRANALGNRVAWMGKIILEDDID
jgi:hypothetical protein